MGTATAIWISYFSATLRAYQKFFFDFTYAPSFDFQTNYALIIFHCIYLEGKGHTAFGAFRLTAWLGDGAAMGGFQFFRYKLRTRCSVVDLAIQSTPRKKFLRDYMEFNCANTRTSQLAESGDRHCLPFWKGLLETLRVGRRGLHLSPSFLDVPCDACHDWLATFLCSQAFKEWGFSHG